jgi:hypothetical protein
MLNTNNFKYISTEKARSVIAVLKILNKLDVINHSTAEYLKTSVPYYLSQKQNLIYKIVVTIVFTPEDRRTYDITIYDP